MSVSFDQATAVQRVAPGRYRAELDGGYGIAEALNGGYLMAVLLRATVEVSPHPHPVATSASFLRVARAGPAEVAVEVRKTGRTATVARVTLEQGGRPVVDATVTTGTLGTDAQPDWIGVPPAMPPLADCLQFERPDPGAPARRAPGSEDPAGPAGADEVGGSEGPGNSFADQVDMRFDPVTMGWLDGQPSDRPEARAYFRVRDGYPPDAYSLALAVDALPPVVLNIGAKGWAPTVELTWHMRAVPASGWLAVHGSGRMVRDGWFDEEVEVWDAAGRLVAQSRQLARLGRGARLGSARTQ